MFLRFRRDPRQNDLLNIISLFFCLSSVHAPVVNLCAKKERLRCANARFGLSDDFFAVKEEQTEAGTCLIAGADPFGIRFAELGVARPFFHRQFRVMPEDAPVVAERLFFLAVDNFKIIHFAKVAMAMLSMKATYASLPDGEFTLAVNGMETIQYKDGSFQSINDASADLTLNHLDATRFLFGPLPPSSVCDIPAKIRPVVEALLPLPLWWNYQDRV